MISFACYDHDPEWWLVEMTLPDASDAIRWNRFLVPEEGVKRSDWQCAYLEQYLNAEGTAKLCELYDEPEEAVCPCRVAFFLYKTGTPKLQTPYGEFELVSSGPVPDRLRGIVEFE